MRHFSMDTLGEWSDDDDAWIWDVNEWEYNDPEADDIVRNIPEVQTGEGEKRKK